MTWNNTTNAPRGAPLSAPAGAYRDRLLLADGRVIDRGWHHNMIVDRARLLIAGFMRGDTPTGIEQLLIGRGLPAWDDGSPPAAPRSTHALVDALPFEVSLTAADIEYVGAAGESATGPTNELRLVVSLGANQPSGEDPYPLREFGLFGRFGTEAYMINYVRHGVIHKPADATLERTIQLVF